MIDQPFRKWLAPRVDTLLGLYAKYGLTPNHLTLTALTLSILAAGCVAIGLNWLALLFWWSGRLLDGTDGIYARKYGLTSRFGAYLDIVCDMASYSVIVLGLAVQHAHLGLLWPSILVLYVLCITSALSFGNLEAQAGIGRSDNRGLRLGAGLAEGGETGIAYTLFFLFPNAIHWLAPLWLLVLITTVVSRSLLARRVVG